MRKNPEEEIGNAFAETAIRLLTEFGKRLETLRAEALDLLKRHDEAPNLEREQALARRYRSLQIELNDSLNAYNSLIRQSSQWLQHGKVPAPHLKLELDVRLTDFQTMMNSLQKFFNDNLLF